MQVWIGVALSIGLLAGCSDSHNTSKTVFDDQIGALKKAQAVDAKVQEGAEKLRQSVDAATDQPAAGQ